MQIQGAETVIERVSLRPTPIFWITLALSLAMTTFAWWVLGQSEARQRQDEFDAMAEEVRVLLLQRMEAYELVLRGGVALFNASDSVARDEWRDFVATLKLDHNYPGVQGVGYARFLSSQQVESHTRAIRREGFGDFLITPSGQRDAYAVVTYLEPFDRYNRQAFGYDMWSEPVRRTAMEQARDTGTVAVSGKVRLKMEIDAVQQAGFLMYMPLYRRGEAVDTVEQRRAALVGFVYSPFRVGNLKRGAFRGFDRDINIEIYDGHEVSEAKRLFGDDAHRPAQRGRSPLFRNHLSLDLHGHPWTLVVSSTDAFERNREDGRASLVFVAGVLVSLLFAAFVWALSTHRSRALRLAHKMTATARAREVALMESEASLIGARDEAERANRAKSEFLSSVSHELRTPLNAILGLSQLMAADAGVPPLQRRNAEQILNAGQHLLDLINDVLDLAKIAAGRVEVVVQPVALTSILRECEPLVLPMADLRGIALVNAIGSCRDVWVLADPLRLKQVLLNLLSNAIKYNRERGSVKVGCAVAGDGRIRISVQDTGKGIDPALQGALFQPFERLDEARGQVEGVGIGLVITRQLIEMMGGTIGLESELGKGSTFWVELARAELKARTDEALVEPPGDVVPASIARSAAHILVAEDNPVNQAVLRQQLASLGYEQVDFAADGHAAFELWQAGRYGLVLTDIHMPVADGYQLTQWIRAAEPAGRHVPIIAVTANAMQGETDHCLAAGMDDYLAKPVLLAELSAKLGRWLGEAGKPLPCGAAPAGPEAPLVFDKAVLPRYIGDDVSLHVPLIGQYVASLPDCVAPIIQGHTDRQDAPIAFHAHKLKSSSRALGVTQLASLCEALESAACAREWMDIDELVPQVQQAAAEANTVLQGYLAEISGENA